MALPREPRQKMINIMYLVLTAILALNVSAEVIEAFKTVDKSLQSSSANIKASNEVLYKSLTDKLSDDKTKLQAAVWQPNAEKAKNYAAELVTYIDNLKQELKKGAGLTIKSDGKEDFKEDNLDASTRLFETNGEGAKLKAKLEKFKTDMLNIDPKIKAQFENNFPVSTDGVEGKEGKKDFVTGYFHMTPTVAALTILSKFQNNIRTVENQIVSYCHSQVGAVEVHMDQVGVLVGQNSNYLMPGQELVVTAGVGAYSSTVKSNITVNGSPINLVAGQGEYKTTVSGAGKHTIQVSGSFIGEDGKPVAISKTIEYTVGIPGGAAVMLDKMNVFYIGVDNPVTISSGSGWDKTSVSMSGGTISGSGSNRIVRVTQVGAASITVTADGKSSKFDFRVKRIPDPIIKVGPSGGGKMLSNIFRGQQFVRAELENFDFDARFSVTGATIYFNNPGDRNVKQITINSGSLAPAAEYMKTLAPGSSVIFDNIRVVGPDGVTRTIQNPPGFSLY
ncbi:MAG: gliding motility protein GldM [Ferruginibacter sp.]|nr:gliding motility protein GldM [Bacteroidota bacterium]MBX2918998.1 gliding motility protein GldM [Ferruginibacter sp.]MCB0707892.1 gliding motility protein GldM [Chitinophagaceae bacterium]